MKKVGKWLKRKVLKPIWDKALKPIWDKAVRFFTKEVLGNGLCPAILWAVEKVRKWLGWTKRLGISIDGLLKKLGYAGLWSAFKVLGARKRPLTASERQEAKNVFGVSLPLDKVRVWQGSNLLKLMPKHRAMVWFDWIIDPADLVQQKETLIHELVHVWQSRHPKIGMEYVLHSLCEQLRLEEKAYSVPTSDVGKANQLLDLRIEQQASLVAEVYAQKHLGMQDKAKRRQLAGEVYRDPPIRREWRDNRRQNW